MLKSWWLWHVPQVKQVAPGAYNGAWGYHTCGGRTPFAAVWNVILYRLFGWDRTYRWRIND